VGRVLTRIEEVHSASRAAWLWAAVLWVTVASCHEEAAQRRPNILLISLDSVRADTLSFDDAVATPHLAGLAQRGTVFRQAISGTSWTLPAHLQMMTGSPPLVHGVESADVIADPEGPLLAERLSADGYRTLGFYTGGYLSPSFGFARGFDRYVAVGPEDAVSSSGEGPEALVAGAISSGLVAAEVDQLLHGLGDETPLFLFLHLYDPHYDYVPPPPWDQHFDPDYAGSMDGRNFYYNLDIWDESLSPPRRVNDRDLEHIVALYRGEVSWTDQNIGRVLEALERVGRLEDTLVIVTADHGEEFFEHEGRGHRHTLFDELIHVPLLIVPPGGGAPRSVEQQVSLSDIAPTILDFAGGAAPPSMYGRSLRAALNGDAIAARPVVSSLYRASVNRRGDVFHRMTQSVRTEDWKLIRTLIVSPNGKLRVPEAVWFDLRADPAERVGVDDPEDPRLVQAWELFERETAALRAHWEAQAHAPDESRVTDARQELQAQLRALGYVDPDEGLEGHAILARPWGLAPVPAVGLDQVAASRQRAAGRNR